MATPNTETFNRYMGNGVATQFSVGFEYLKQEYVVVYLKRKDARTDEKLTPDRYRFVNETTVEFPVLPSDAVLGDGDVLTVQRETELGSDYSFDNQRRLFPESVMDADDLSFQQIQDIARDTKRAIKVPPTSDKTPEQMWDDFNNGVSDSVDAANRSEASAVRSEEAAARAEGIVDSFDTHAAELKNDFDVNAATLTARFDNNYLAKTNAFDENAQTSTDAFNTNVMTKIDDFDAHAMTKEIEFDDHAAEVQGRVDASASAAAESARLAKLSEVASKASEEECKRLVETLGNLFVFKGTVQTYADLPVDGNKPGDVYRVIELSLFYVWVTTGWESLGGLVDLSSLVTVNTDQDIDAHKTFLKDTGIKSPNLDIRNDRNKRGEGLIFSDMNGTQTAGIGPYVNNNGSPEVRLIASNGTQSAFAGLGVTRDGQGFFWGPEPATDSNNQDYVTSHWVNEKAKEKVSKSGDTMTGALKFQDSGYVESDKGPSTKGLSVFGDTEGYGKGATLSLRSNTAGSSQAGAFKLETGNQVTGHTHTLQGNPDGTMSFDGRPVKRTQGLHNEYDWIGTLHTYVKDEIQVNHPDWLCFITDDQGFTISSAFIPDYKAGVAINSGFVAPTNGLVYVVRGGGKDWTYVYVDDVEVDSNLSNTTTEGGGMHATVGAGSKVTFSSANISSATFFPMKGVK